MPAINIFSLELLDKMCPCITIVRRVYWALKEVVTRVFVFSPELSVQGERSVKRREKSGRKVAIRLSIEIKINMHS